LKTKAVLSASEDEEEIDLLYITGGNGNWHSHSGNFFWQFLLKLNTYLAYALGISLLAFVPEK
jgi:hypothetical protein